MMNNAGRLLFFFLFVLTALVGAESTDVEKNLDSIVPVSRDDFFFRGIDYYTLGLFEKAQTDIEKSLEIDSFFVKGYNYLGIIHSRQGHYEKAVHNYSEALKIEPMYAEANQNLGRLYLENNKTELAIKQLRKTVFIQVGNPMSHYLLGVAYYMNGEIRQSAEQYEKVVGLDPELLGGQVFYNLGVCYQEMRNYPKAIRNYELVIARKRVTSGLLNNMALCFRAMGDGDRAASILGEVLNQDPGNFKALLNLGNLLLDQGAFAEAKKIYDRALVISPENQERILINLGLLYARSKKPDRAAQVWQKVLSRNPNNIQAANSLANLYLEDRKFDEAVIILKKLVQLSPSNGSLWNALGYTLIDQNRDLEWGKSCIEKALALDPANHAIYYDSLGWYFYRKGDLERAKTHIERAIDVLDVSHEGDSSEINFHLALVHRAMNNNHAEKQYLRNALIAEPRSHYATLAGKELLRFSRKIED